jgi:sortase A
LTGVPCGISSSSKSWQWILALVLVSIGVSQIASGYYIYAKAEFAQWLLDSAWQRTLAGEVKVKPWQWADTWPVARLYLPGSETSLMVLSGSSLRNLAFGPGYMQGTSYPGTPGNTVIVGHRDTHFRDLAHLSVGQSLIIESDDGRSTNYRITDLIIADESQTDLLQTGDEYSLTLITCYPFDALVPGGPLRFVVRAIGTS